MLRSVLVVGADQAVGQSVALCLARSGFEVFGTGRDQEAAAQIGAIAVRHELTVRGMVADLVDPSSCEHLVDSVEPWALVLTEEEINPGHIADVPMDEVRRQFERNVFAPARLAQLLLPQMKARGDGRIVRVTEARGVDASIPNGWHEAASASLAALLDVLRHESDGSGIEIVTVASSDLDASTRASVGRALATHQQHALDPHAYEVAKQQLAAERGDPEVHEHIAEAVRDVLLAGHPPRRRNVGNGPSIAGILPMVLRRRAPSRPSRIRPGARAARGEG